MSDFSDSDPEATTEIVRARLKWFNGPKGFGFVVPEGEDTDAFLHVTTLQRAGLQTLGEGADVLCAIRRGPKGAMVIEISEVLNLGITPANKPKTAIPAHAETAQPACAMRGTVKWYKTEKGFGFIIPEDRGKDVFVHKACLEQHGIAALEPGQVVDMTVKTAQKGREAVSIAVLT